MCKLIYSMTVSLDGYISGPQGEFDWTAPDEELHRFHNDQVRELGGHLLGRRLYEVMSYWETAEERNPAARNFSRWMSPVGVRRLACRPPRWCLGLVG